MCLQSGRSDFFQYIMVRDENSHAKSGGTDDNDIFQLQTGKEIDYRLITTIENWSTRLHSSQTH